MSFVHATMIVFVIVLLNRATSDGFFSCGVKEQVLFLNPTTLPF